LPGDLGYILAMDRDFRNCIIFSAVIHGALILPLCNFNIIKDRKADKDSIVVDYIVTADIIRAEDERPKPLIAETPRVEMKPKVEETPAAGSPPAKRQAKEKADQELIQKQEKIRSTKDYIGYYQLIREKIRIKLKENYRREHNEGDVVLSFLLRANGALAAYDFDRAASTRDKKLADIAISSLKEASPFPPFPRAMDVPSMSFDLMVSFRKD